MSQDFCLPLINYDGVFVSQDFCLPLINGERTEVTEARYLIQVRNRHSPLWGTWGWRSTPEQAGAAVAMILEHRDWPDARVVEYQITAKVMA